MATPAVIKVEGINYVMLYKHFDGNPEATLQWLKDFNKDFTNNRGVDPSYKFAQLVRSSERDAKKYNLDASKYTGWGVIETSEYASYVYTLLNTGDVYVS